jgi:hypothetical protein
LNPDNPKVTVVIPHYNGEEILRQEHANQAHQKLHEEQLMLDFEDPTLF